MEENIRQQNFDLAKSGQFNDDNDIDNFTDADHTANPSINDPKKEVFIQKND